MEYDTDALFIDIKEVLLFPAMKPESATGASTSGGPAGQIQN